MEALTRLRTLKGYSMRALAEESGVSVVTINAIENDQRGARPSTLRKLAATLNVEVADLFGEQEAPKGSEAASSAEWVAVAPDEAFERMVDEADPAGLLAILRDLHDAIGAADDRDERLRLLRRTDRVLSGLRRNYGPLQPGSGWEQPKLSDEVAHALGRNQKEEKKAG